VTGGSRGIGRGIVLKLTESGINRIAINYLSNDDAANDTAKKTKDRGAEAILVKGDVGEPEEVKRMFAKVKGDFDGSLGIFVHSARPNPGAWLAPPMEATPEGFRQAFDSASVAMAVACQECVPLMPKGGRIIGITYALGSRTGSWQVLDRDGRRQAGDGIDYSLLRGRTGEKRDHRECGESKCY
jgi:NAD(P)-dependent dehydrogenase (short-subunit alcohol dehydrogenase family)